MFSRIFSDGFRDRGELLLPEGDNAGRSGPPATSLGIVFTFAVVKGVVGATSVGATPLGVGFRAAFVSPSALEGLVTALALGAAFVR